MDKPFLVFGAPLIEQAEIDEVIDSLASGWLGTEDSVGVQRIIQMYCALGDK